MTAIDTNVLVRFLTRDHPRQAAHAAALLRTHEVWIAKTVLLETEWVLRSLYQSPPGEVRRALLGLAGLPNVHLEDAARVAEALEWYGEGLELADALHLASRGKADRFVTFDEKFLRRARRFAPVEAL